MQRRRHVKRGLLKLLPLLLLVGGLVLVVKGPTNWADIGLYMVLGGGGALAVLGRHGASPGHVGNEGSPADDTHNDGNRHDGDSGTSGDSGGDGGGGGE